MTNKDSYRKNKPTPHINEELEPLIIVGAPGVEPGTSCTPCKRASRTALRPDSINCGQIIAYSDGSGNPLVILKSYILDNSQILILNYRTNFENRWKLLDLKLYL